ncbi:MAG TPA: M50 family metallopeptidase [Solirubrobacteraceae bacterium]|jgi:regulator of sigma E protease|nr:M50 family metallopeptidase [Solirubrobacteraceae bacterium]
MSWLLAFLGFALLIILHELGHFTAAKAVGMRVERFALFFPPLLGRVRRGETEYAIGAVPLGGYVRITGMNPAEEIPADVAHRAYYRQPVWKRIVVIGAGPAVNIVLAFLLLAAYLLIWGVPKYTITNDVEALSTTGASAQVLRLGDEVIAVDGVSGTPDELRDQVSKHTCAGTPVDGCVATSSALVTVRRDGEQQSFRITPIYSAQEKRPLLGFSYGSERSFDPVGGVGAAVSTSADQLWFFTTTTVKTIVGIFDPEKRKEISGIVGSYETTRQAIELSTDRAVFLLAVISLSLGIINLFPFLPLDGGHIFWALAEKVRGRAIPFSVMERSGFIGFALVIALFAIGLSNDIGRLTGEGFQVR